MKGKVAFVLGAAVGYVLGTRAGRERYAQIKRGAQAVWQTAPVQRGVGLVRDAAQDQVDNVKAAAVRAGKGAFAAFLQDEAAAKPASSAKPAPSGKPATEPAASSSSGPDDQASKA